MVDLKTFRSCGADFSPLGLERGNSHSDCFCTPKGARMIGWAGVDGIHFCHISRFGQRVFAVDPMGTFGDYVYPVAKTLQDFLRLILACGSTAPVQQARGWSGEQFDAFLRENPPTAEMADALQCLGETFALKPMKNPYAYIQKVQVEFDCSTIQRRPEYWDFVPEEPVDPEWAVYFNGNFWGHSGRERPGQPLALNQHFRWGEDHWYVPAAYLCTGGIVLDLCKEVEPARMQRHMEKWMDLETGARPVTGELRQQARAENPMRADFHAKLYVNGKETRQKGGCGIGWLPASCVWEGFHNELEARWLVEHYGLDRERAWNIRRVTFRWATKTKPKTIRSLRLILAQDSIDVAGPHFHGAGAGMEVPFTHPATGVQHTLHVLECEPQELPESFFHNEERIYPRCCMGLSYAVVPELIPRELQVRDCAESDPPRNQDGSPNSSGAVAVGVICRTNDPNAVCALGVRPQNTASSLHFAPPADVEWRLTFRLKTMEDTEVTLL